MRRPAYFTTVLTAVGVLVFLAPTAPAQSTGSTGQSGTRSTDRSRPDPSTRPPMSDSPATQSNPSGNAQMGDETAKSSSKSSAGAEGNLSSFDKKFVADAAQGGMAEVELGRLAADKAASDQVKEFGKKMVDDHTKANDELKDLAGRKGVTLPTEINTKDKAVHDRLSKMGPTEFDREYMKYMEKDHKKDVAEFRKASERAKDPDIKQWAAKTLPTLEEHDRMAHDSMAALTGSATPGNTARSEKHKGTSTDTNTTTGTGDRSTTGDQQRNPK